MGACAKAALPPIPLPAASFDNRRAARLPSARSYTYIKEASVNRLGLAFLVLGISLSAFGEITLGNRGGAYAGDGTWSGRTGLRGKLSVKSSLSVNRDANGHLLTIDVSSAYKIIGLPMGDSYQIRHEWNGFFELYGKNGKKRGEGYCVGDHCHISMPADKLEETILFDAQGCMSRFGSKVELGSLWNWDEKLCPVK